MNTRIAARRQFIRNRAVPLTIGFTAIADFSSFIGQEYIAGIMSAANDYGVNFINRADATRHSLFVDAHFLDEYLTKFSFMRPPLLDGLVTWASTLCEYMDRARVQELFTALKPLPMVDIGYLDIPGVPSIRVDNKHSMHLLVDHLVHIHGFKRLAFMGSSSSSPHISRMECFKQELASCGLAWDDSRIFMAASIQADSLQEEAQALLRRFYRDGQMQLDAVVTSSDIIASALIAELEKEGISVPEDLAVTGFNNQYSGITAATPVTTIDLVYFKRGYEAVERLLDRIMGLDQDVETHRVKTSLVVRQSCGCFEKSIVDALNCDSCSQARALPGLGFPESDTQTAASRESDEQSDQTSENDVRSYLTSGLKGVFSVPQEKLSLLVDGIIADIYETTIQITPPYRRQTAARPTFLPGSGPSSRQTACPLPRTTRSRFLPCAA